MEYNVFQNNKILEKLKDDKGWKLYNLLDIFKDDTKNALKIKKEDYLLQGKYPIVDQGQRYIGGYTDIDDNLYEDTPSIIFGDHTRIIKYIDFPIFIGADGVKLLKPIIDSSELNVKYAYFFLKSIRLPSDGYSRHFKYLKQLVIPVPSIKIQDNIVNALDKADELIEKRKSQIEALDELVKSKFIEMFGDLNSNSKGWAILNFNEFAVIETNMTKDFEKYADYPHIGIDSIEKNTGNILEYQLVKDSSLKSGKYLFDERHIIYSKIRPNLNKVALPQFKGVCSADAYPILCLDEIVHRNYLGYVLRSEFFLSYILAFSGRTNIPKVNKEQLKGFNMPIPPIELQNQFADFVKQIDKLKFEMEESLKELENNFNSLMQKAFKGELFN